MPRSSRQPSGVSWRSRAAGQAFFDKRESLALRFCHGARLDGLSDSRSLAGGFTGVGLMSAACQIRLARRRRRAVPRGSVVVVFALMTNAQNLYRLSANVVPRYVAS